MGVHGGDHASKLWRASSMSVPYRHQLPSPATLPGWQLDREGHKGRKGHDQKLFKQQTKLQVCHYFHEERKGLIRLQIDSGLTAGF